MLTSLPGGGWFFYELCMAIAMAMSMSIGPEPHHPSTLLRHESCPDSRSIAAELDQQMGVSGCRWPEEWSFALEWDDSDKQWRLDKIVDGQVLESNFVVGDCYEVEQAVIIQLKSDLLSSGKCGDEMDSEIAEISLDASPVDLARKVDSERSNKPIRRKTPENRKKTRTSVAKLRASKKGDRPKPQTFLVLGVGGFGLSPAWLGSALEAAVRVKFSRNLETGLDFQWMYGFNAKSNFDLRAVIPLCIWTSPRRWNVAFCATGCGIYRQFYPYANGLPYFDVGRPFMSESRLNGTFHPRSTLEEQSSREIGLGIGLNLSLEWVVRKLHRVGLTVSFFYANSWYEDSWVRSSYPFSVSVIVSWRHLLSSWKKSRASKKRL